jgi:uncharacterized membrane protein YfcA
MISFFSIIFTILIGLITGLFTGFTGLSAMGIVLMALTSSHIIDDYKTIIGTVLYVLMFPTTIAAVLEYHKQDKINFLVGNLLLISLLVGSYIGAKITLSSKYKISEKTIKYTTSFIALSMGTYFFITAYNMK